MKTCPKCRETKERTEFSKSKDSKDGLQGKCKVCKKVYYEANKEREIARQKAWYEANKERAAAYQKAWAEANKERKAANDKAWYEANKDKRNALDAKRRAKKLAQTPDLTELEKAHLEHIYWMAKDCKAVTGEMYHVDHIVAIANGGLHHPDNLQVMHWKDNLSKGAK